MAHTVLLSRFHSAVVKMPQLTVKAFQFGRGDSLPEMHQVYWLIQSGYVRTITWDMSGNITTLGIWGPGDILSSDFSQIQPYQMECLSKVHVDRVALPGNLPEVLLHHHRCTEELLNISHCRQIDRRLLKMMNCLGNRFGEDAGDCWIKINLSLTHQQLADLLGTTRVTVTRLIGTFQRAGVLRRLPSYQFMLRRDAENLAAPILKNSST
jgi:CRP-like cAMP-binding protein